MGRGEEARIRLWQATYIHFSDISYFAVPVAPPTNITIIEVSAHSVVLSWEPPPKEYQNGQITGYVVTVHEKTKLKQTMDTIDNGTTVSSLDGNTQYLFSVAAKTHVGTGPFSEAVHVKTKINGK